MLNSFKGLVGDNNIIDLISTYSFPHDPQGQQDAGSMFIQAPLDLYNTVADDLQSGLLLTQLGQDRSKTPGSPKKDYHLAKKVQTAPKGSLLGPRTDQDFFGDDDDDDLEKEGDEDGSDSDTDSNKKRGKYRTYTDEEKAHIIKFMMKHGIQQTLEIFSGGEHKITKRKLKSWLESQNKIKGVKGRKSNDPARDRALHEWCMDFQNEHGRPPSRKEATQKALELSGDPNFQASKGWLDKFSRKYNIEFTPLKIIPPRGKKKVKTDAAEPVSAASASTQASGLLESLSPLKDHKMKTSELEAKKTISPALGGKEMKQPENFMKVNPMFNKPMYQQPAQQMPQMQQQANPMPIQPQVHQQAQPQQQPQQQGQQYPQMPANNHDGNYPPIDSGIYQSLSNLDGQQGQGFAYPFNYPLEYSMPYSLNYPKVYPRKSYPMNYPMNLPMNYTPPGFAEMLQQMMRKKENDMGMEKTQFS